MTIDSYVRICRNDALVSVDYGELIDTVFSNCGTEATPDDVEGILDSILHTQVEDAKYTVRKNMDEILKQIRE